MKRPHELLVQASVRLFAEGHAELAYDLRRLALKWTPENEKRLIHGPETIDDDTDYDHLSPIHDL
jgi:hypothetical protein